MPVSPVPAGQIVDKICFSTKVKKYIYYVPNMNTVDVFFLILQSGLCG